MANAPSPAPGPPTPGTRDLLPPDADARAYLIHRMAKVAYQRGYHRVIVPPFERASLWDPHNRAGDLIRFVEPDSGEIACLRPDMTPQVARMVSNQLKDRPAPHRLYYDGVVVRRAQGRARRHQQMTQFGAELVQQNPSPHQLAEVVVLLAEMLGAAGLGHFTLELNHAGLARQLLRQLPAQQQEAAANALRRKNPVALAQATKGLTNTKQDTVQGLRHLLELYGDLGTIERARVCFSRSKEITPLLDHIEECASAIGAVLAPGELTIDLGEPEGMSYYNGVSFALYGPGPGTPIGRGGLYGTVVNRGRTDESELSGAGFALTLETLEWALSAAGNPRTQESSGIVLFDPANATVSSRSRNDTWDQELRARGVRVTQLRATRFPANDYAVAWGFDHIANVDDQSILHLYRSSAFGRHETPMPCRTCDEVLSRLEEK